MCVLFNSLFVCISAHANVYFKTTIIKQNIKIILLQNNIHVSEVHCGSAVRFGQALLSPVSLTSVSIGVGQATPIVTASPWYAAIPDLLCALAVSVLLNI